MPGPVFGQTKMIIPRNINAELAAIIQKIKQDDKQKLRQPLNKRMTSDAYAAYIARRAS
jgi:hypothetical protein